MVSQNSSLKLATPMPALRSDLQLQFDLKSRNKLRYVKDETKREKERKTIYRFPCPMVSCVHACVCLCDRCDTVHKFSQSIQYTFS